MSYTSKDIKNIVAEILEDVYAIGLQFKAAVQ